MFFLFAGEECYFAALGREAKLGGENARRSTCEGTGAEKLVTSAVEKCSGEIAAESVERRREIGKSVERRVEIANSVKWKGRDC